MAFRLTGLAAFALLALPAAAQGLPDPTRPPAAFLAAASQAPGTAPAGPQLTSVIVPRSSGARPAAIIDGTRVELGHRLHDARLVAVGEDAVLLDGPNGRLKLWLTPDARKRTSASGAGAKAKN